MLCLAFNHRAMEKAEKEARLAQINCYYDVDEIKNH